MGVCKYEILDVEVKIATELGVTFINFESRQISFSAHTTIFSFRPRSYL